MKLSGWARLWIATAALALTGCDGQYYQSGKYSYGCYLGPLAGTHVVVEWSGEGERADTIIQGHAYTFRLTRGGLMSDDYKDGDATLMIDPELRFTPTPGAESSLCNAGSQIP
jgi:hypothetical protein